MEMVKFGTIGPMGITLIGHLLLGLGQISILLNCFKTHIYLEPLLQQTKENIGMKLPLELEILTELW